jgi:O-antigen/teichoic acid export membrane protein
MMSTLKKIIRVLVARVSGTAGNLVLLLLVARNYGPVASGYVFSAIASGYMTAHFFNIGLSRYTLKTVSIQKNPKPTIETLKTLATLISLFLLAAAGVVLTLIYFVAQPGFPLTLYGYGSVLGAFLGFQLINADILKSEGKTEAGILFEISLFPWSASAMIGLAAFAGLDSPMVPVAMLVAAAALVCALILLTTAVGQYRPITKPRIKEACRLLFADQHLLGIFWFSGIAVVFASRLPGIAAPLVADPAGVGFLAVGVGIASLGGTITHAVQSYFAPRFSQAAAAHSRQRLAKQLLTSQAMSFFLFLLVALPCFFTPSYVTQIFGTEFSTMETRVLQIMVAGQLIRTLSGCSELFLSMVGRAKFEAAALLASIAVFLGVSITAYDILTGTELIAWAYAAMLATRGIVSATASYAFLATRPVQAEVKL